MKWLDAARTRLHLLLARRAAESRMNSVTAIVLILVGLAACGPPVRRALRIEPAEALRNVG